ncbi:uncharacterized protein [Apostichopus japonicus]|uniref:uncharacterized protein isoform X2 n=1 Tax=Stichopus japonicus TaxID=307972 RepID=UPI003AB7D105
MEVLKILVLFMVSSPFIAGTVLPCYEKVYAELGERASINCNLSDIGDVFWYSGKTAFDFPIVKLENGRKRFSEGGRKLYDISETGALIINEVTKSDFDQYKIIHVLLGRPIEEAIVTLQQPIAPKRSCPQIGECFDCRKCVIKNTDTITCSVSGSRPLVNFTFDAINMTHVTNTTTKIQYDNSSDTWTTSSTITIHSRSCNMSLNLGCNVEGNYPFELSDSYANVQFGNTRGRDPERTDSTDDIPLMKNSKIDMKTKLIRYLGDQYSKMGLLTPLPFGKKIHIKRLYTPTTFEVTEQGGKWYTVDSDEFLKPTKLDLIKRALFKIELGNGKTTLQKYLAWKWSTKTEEQKKKKLLLFLEVQDVNMGLAEALHQTLPTDLDINKDDFLQLLKTDDCQIVLYGLETISDQTKDTKKQEKPIDGDIQIKRVLAGPIDEEYPNLQFLVTTNELNNAVPCFTKPYTEIQMNNFNTEQLHNYIKKVCNIYNPSNSINSESRQDKVAMVERHLNDNDLIKIFRDCPLFLGMFIHILSSDGKYSAKYEININKFSSLVDFCVSFLVLKYRQTQNANVSHLRLKMIERTLGKVSLNDREKITSTWELNELETLVGKNDLYVAVQIGFLKLTSGNITNARYNTLNNVTFFHPCVQDFLIAEYIVDTDDKQRRRFLQMLLSTSDRRERVARVLQFVCGKSKDTKLISEILQFVVDNHFWNVFIDCLHEVRDDVNVKVLTKGNLKTALSTQNVDIDMLERRFHQNAVLDFCNLCQANKITLTTMCFNGLVPDSFVKELTLPTIKQLILQKPTFDDDLTVTTLIEKATKDNSVETLRFIECNLPERITLSDNLRGASLTSKCKVIKSEQSDSTDQLVLNFRTGNWN